MKSVRTLDNSIPMSQATQEQVIAFTKLVQEFSIPIWIDGGWGVDALLGAQTRPHSDLDIIINNNDLTQLKELLISNQFELRLESDVTSVVFDSKSGLAVDVHRVNFDQRGFGIFKLPDGREWPFPPSAFRGSGNIGGIFVNCLSPEAQVQCHAQGYQPTEKDLADMEALQNRFGVVLPLALCRQREDENAA
jgi:lincosamide nucleotidyltransferase A/C/D/E